MELKEIIAGYTPVGDVITLVLCIILGMLINASTSHSKDRNYDIFKMSSVLIAIAAVANIMFYVIIEYIGEDIVGVFAMHFINHNILLANLFLYIIYLRNLMGLDEKTKTRIIRIAGFIVVVGIFFDSISQVTRFGFYHNEEGMWFEPRFLNPFMITYFACLLFILMLFIIYKDNVITQVRSTFVFMGFMCALIVIIQSALGNNAYMTFTFVLPVIGVFAMIHSHPYELSTGALGTEALSDYIEACNRNDKDMAFLSIRFKLGRGQEELPEGLGRAIHIFWQKNYKSSKLFKVDGDTYILAIEERTNGNNKELIDYFRYLIVEVFPEHYEKFKIPYKIMAFEPSKFMQNSANFLSAIDYYDNRIPDNTYVFVNYGEYKKLARVRYILDQLNDICLTGDLNDPRVFVYAQPIKEVATDKFSTAEALMRLRLPKTGFIYPDEFIGLAEEFDYIHRLSLIMLNKTCKELKRLLDDGFYIKRISVNISVGELLLDSFNEEVLEIIKANDIPEGKIAIEITESEDEKAYLAIEDSIEGLKSKNISFYLDDYGTGYSNFTRMIKLGFNVIKFDKSMVRMAREDDRVRNLIKSLIDGFKSYGFEIVFEGVETMVDVNLSVELGADYLQGYIYSKPEPIDKMRVFFNLNGDRYGN